MYAVARVLSSAMLCSLTGGMLWALGMVGKRYGVEGAHPNQRAHLSALCSLIFLMSTLLLPGVELLSAGDLAIAGLKDSGWLHRLPMVVLAGMISGIGSLLSMYSLILACPSGSSALASVITNGTYTAGAPILLTCFFREEICLLHWLGIIAVCLGVPMMDPALSLPVCRSRRPSEETAKANTCFRETLPHYGSTFTAPRHSGLLDKFQWELRGQGGVRAALWMAAFSGLFWDIGILGRRYGMQSSPQHLNQIHAVLTLLVLNSSSCIAPMMCLMSMGSASLLPDPNSRQRIPVVMITGAFAGLGGFLLTYSMSLAGRSGSAVVSTIANGVFTVFGALLIAAMYREKPTFTQFTGATVTVMGICMMGM